VRLPTTDLDAILALQLTIAWSGERAGEPSRLGWWSSDLVDALGGADLFSRLTPRTAAWAPLLLVRKVAQQVDAEARGKLAQPDGVWTLFRFGFDVDEQLDERIALHRQHRATPSDVLGPRYLHGEWSRARLDDLLSALPRPKVDVTPAGRRVVAKPASVLEAAELLAAALAPLPDAYPMPYVERS
jgi:hypothetical protein